MLQNSIIDRAIESSDLLLLHAAQNQTSLIRYPVKRIERQEIFIRLHFDMVLANTDDLQLQIGPQIYPHSTYKISEFDPKTRTAKILCDDDHLKRLEAANPSDVFLICDLTFLISRVQNWYKKYGNLLMLPNTIPQASPCLNSVRSAQSSPEQTTAIEGALTHPISYVWGAPGTGKTQFVLTNCILSYLQKDDSSRILVLAPTNRAIEQVLYGVLPNLEVAGMNEKTVLRLGAPTKEFAEKYPEICEDHSLVEKIQELNAYIEDSLAQLDLVQVEKERHEKYHNYLNSRSRFFNLLQRAEEAIGQKVEFFNKKNSLKKDIREINDSIQTVSLSINHSTEIAKKAEEKAAVIARKIKKYSSPLLNVFFKEKLLRLQKDLSEYVDQSEELFAKAERLTIRLQKHKDTLIVKKDDLSALCNLEEESEKIIEEFIDFSVSLRLIPRLLSSKKSPKVIEEAAEKGRVLFEKKEAEYAGLKEADLDFLKMRESKLSQQIEEYRSAARRCHESHQIRMNECRILACTLDCCIGRLQPDGDFKPDHIFLDEAGYSPLIKTATITAFGCPVTLLGDHMQLPPVCEIDDRKIEQDAYKSVFLWAQSAIYLEELFNVNFEELHRQYIEHHPPSFRKMPKYDLTHSFRFSSSLAAILAGNVYSEKLQGSEEHKTEIYYIHTPFKAGEKRTNLAECEAIRNYVLQHQEDEIGIITPYVNQRRLLKKMLPGFTEINTVHGAQGREWDHVILSVVDTTNKWFTDSLSTISNGKKVINTAVSRAKKSLIIVGDCYYWKNQPRQLLGKILSIAEELPIERQTEE